MLCHYYHYHDNYQNRILLEKCGRKDMAALELIVSFACKGVMPLAQRLPLWNQ